jgi:hypothetical protein
MVSTLLTVTVSIPGFFFVAKAIGTYSVEVSRVQFILSFAKVESVATNGRGVVV